MVPGKLSEDIAAPGQGNIQNAVLGSEAEFGDSEHTFAPRLIAVQPFISRTTENGRIVGSIGGTGAENCFLFGCSLLGSCFGEEAVHCAKLWCWSFLQMSACCDHCRSLLLPHLLRCSFAAIAWTFSFPHWLLVVRDFCLVLAVSCK